MNAKTVTYWMGTDKRTSDHHAGDHHRYQVTWLKHGNGVSRFTLDRGTGILNIIDQQGKTPGRGAVRKLRKVFYLHTPPGALLGA